MSRSSLLVVIALVLLSPIPLWCAGDEPMAGVPTMKEVTPAVALPGAKVAVTGEYLGKTHVSEVYLTRASVDTKVQIVSQTKTDLKFLVPADIEPGRYGITVLTNTKTPLLLDQPVYLNVKRELETAAR